MTVEIGAVDIEVSFRKGDNVLQVREYALKRLSKVINSLPNLVKASVEISVEQAGSADRRCAVQATLSAKGTLLRAEDHGPDAMSAIDSVHDVLARRIRDRKRRLYQAKRKKAARHKDAVGMETARTLPDESPDLVTRIKSHETKPLFTEDAIEQMDLLGHDFFFFLNAETGQHNVVYRRKGGGYGLIQPAIGDFTR
jgi:putative sigma-54 modulation protein